MILYMVCPGEFFYLRRKAEFFGEGMAAGGKIDKNGIKWYSVQINSMEHLKNIMKR